MMDEQLMVRVREVFAAYMLPTRDAILFIQTAALAQIAKDLHENVQRNV